MGPTQWWKLRQIEVVLRKDDPGLDALLAGRRPPRRPAVRAPLTWLLLAYLAPVGPIVAGLVLPINWLAVAGAVSCPFVPVISWLLISRHHVHGGPSHDRKP